MFHPIAATSSLAPQFRMFRMTLYLPPMSDAPLPVPPVQVNFALDIGWGTLQISAEVPSERVNLVQILPALKQVTSNIMNAVAGVGEQSGHIVSCQAGCGACCRQMVPVSLFEMEELANWVQTLPPEQQVALESRFQIALAALRESGVLERLDLKNLPGKVGQQGEDLSMDYLRAKVACPFLVDESCSIHPIRPLICREYLVTSPPEFCTWPTVETVRPVPRPVKLSQALFALGQAVTAEQQGWMPLVFLFGWIRSGMTVAAAYQGTGPDLLRMVIERIATSENPTDIAFG